jgi:hypothetical protein
VKRTSGLNEQLRALRGWKKYQNKLRYLAKIWIAAWIQLYSRQIRGCYWVNKAIKLHESRKMEINMEF